MTPEISVIVPAFNVEKYIKRAIDSILAQNFQDFEIIIINDASTDETLNVLHKYYGDNKKIIIKSNEKTIGVGLSRNIGLSKARGNYLAFVDSDDWIEPDMLQKLHDIAIITKADIVACGMRLVFEEGHSKPYHAYEFDVQGGIKALEFLSEYKIGSVIWNKLYKKELIDNNAILFPDICHGEDVIFTMLAVYNCSIFVSIADEFYNYYQSSNSITRKKLTEKHLKAYIEIYNIMVHFFYKIGLAETNDGCKLQNKFFESQTVWILPKLLDFYKDTEKAERDKILDSVLKKQFADNFQFVKSSLDFLIPPTIVAQSLEHIGIKQSINYFFRALKNRMRR